MKRVPIILALTGLACLTALGSLVLFAADFVASHHKVAVVFESGITAVPVNQQTDQYFWHDERVRQGDSLPALVARLGVRVHVVAGDPDNLKITTSADLLLAELLLAERMRALGNT